MKNLQVLDVYKQFSYVYHDYSELLQKEYDKMYGIIKANGHALASDSWSLDGGILLEASNEVIAGAFFNLTKSQSSILIHIIYVDDNHRCQGIYKKMHSLIDQLGKETGRKNIYSYIHQQNDIMQNHIIEKIGYKTVMHLVKRDIK